MTTTFDKLTGQLLLRKVGQPGRVLNPGYTRSLFMVNGVIAVPDDFSLKGEHQYDVMGYERDGRLIVVVPSLVGNDLSAITIGSGFGHLHTQGIWRV